MANLTLIQQVEEMRNLGELLIPYTFPIVDFKNEQEILILKQKIFFVDGYEILACYSKAKYEHYHLESVQVQSVSAPFLPFAVVCKLGRAFLGSYNLCYIEFFKSRKVYCWTVKSRDGRSLPPDEENEPGSFEGFEFNILQPGIVDLF